MTPTSTNLPRLLAQVMRTAIDANDTGSLREIADQLDALPEAWAEDTALLNASDEIQIVIGRAIGNYPGHVNVTPIRDGLREMLRRAARDVAQTNTGG